MSVTIKDIAAKAGVSPATVSLVINNKPGVGKKTRERILTLIEDLAYEGPSTKQPGQDSIGSISFLQITRHGHTLNRDHDVFIADYIRGMSQEAKSKNMSLKIMTYKTTPIEEIAHTIRSSEDTGFVILGTELSFQDIQAFAGLEKPIVFLDSFYQELRFDFIDMNNEDSVNQILLHFIELGHREIGMISSTQPTPNFKLREKAFREGLGRHGLEFKPSRIIEVDSTFNGACDDMRLFIQKGKKLPRALFCANDIIASGCMKAFNEAGIRVPEDVSLAGFDNLPIASMSTPGLTTIDVCKNRMGRMAIQLLMDRILVDPEAPPAKVVFGGKLIIRESIMDLTSL